MPLGLIRVVSVMPECLVQVHKRGQDECVREGFPNLSPGEFIARFIVANRLRHEYAVVNRIEFEYIGGEA